MCIILLYYTLLTFAIIPLFNSIENLYFALVNWAGQWYSRNQQNKQPPEISRVSVRHTNQGDPFSPSYSKSAYSRSCVSCLCK